MAEQIYAAMIALEGDALLLPNAAVAEVLGRRSVQADPARPQWFAGYVDWNNRSVPAVQFETLNGGAPVAASRRQKVVIIHSPGVHVESGTIALICQGYPHLVTLSRAALQTQPVRSTDRDELVLARARISSREAIIPDLEAVEAAIARVSG